MKLERPNNNRSFYPVASVRNVDEQKYRITHVINTKALDRYDTVVLPKGCAAEQYLKNPVVLWLHNTDKSVVQVPIGKCVELSIGEDEIVTTTEFNPNDPLAVKVFQAYRDGFMRAWSIGFMPKSFEEITPVNYAQIKEKYNLPNLNITQEEFEKKAFWGIWVISEWELLEYSAVPVPGNPEALSDEDVEKFSRELVTRGIIEEAEARRINFRDLLKKKETEKPAESQPVQEAQTGATAEGSAIEAKPAESSTVATSNNSEVPGTVAELSLEGLKAEIEALKAENQALKTEVGQLTQRNCELSERMAKAELQLAEGKDTVRNVSDLQTIVAEIKKSVEVDNIDKTRQLEQKTKSGANVGSFFSDFLRSRV